MDPFEVRIRFTGLIVNLNASVISATKAAQYALKHREMDEDLHSCIIEQLEMPRNTMNNKANIMYFVEHLCDMAAKEKHVDYVRMIQRDMVRIVDAVAPEDGTGAANIKVVRKVLQALGMKGYLQAQTVTEIQELLKERDTASTEHALLSPQPVETGPKHAPRALSQQKIDRKVVEQRIEEDRERHKRLRESIWAIPTSLDQENEAEILWENTSDIGEDDYVLYSEEAEERMLCFANWKRDGTKNIRKI
ncbi:putative ctd kinase subunit gamma protein [Erysiphe necator]|uniref:Putative ctd kinase subunit gamma protein n=1 Tax=Uncinula necator TaxID=52586 RepID=A0A0B1P010_UNCNE|nr:putative ctd kinase subunit gamma protein [Erysiphe necator]